jgi:hypothetical protein
MLETYLNMRRRGEIHFEKTERAQLLDKIAALEGEVAALKAGAPAPEEPSAPPPDNVVPLPRATAGKQNSAQAPPPPAAASAPVAGELVMVVDPSSEEPWRDYVEPTGEIRSTPRGPGRYWGPV